MSKKTQNWAVPLIAVLLGMLIGAVLMLIFGYDPFWAYYDLFSTAFGSLKNIGEILRAMSPLILIALGFSVASKAGFFNVGLPGQALAGWTSAVWFALSFPELPKVVFSFLYSNHRSSSWWYRWCNSGYSSCLLGN